MRRRRSVIQLGLATLLVATSVFGCRDTERDDGRTLVRIWHPKISISRDVLEQTVENFNASQSEIIVETLYKQNEELRNLFVTAAVGGQGPEIVYGPSDNVGLYVLTETLRPLEDLFEPAFFEQFTDEGLIELGDSTWIVADQIGNHLMLVYNKDLMPDPPETFDELIQMSEDLTADTDGDGQIDRYALTWGYGEPYFFIPFLTGFGGWVYDENGDPSLDTEATANAIRFLLELREKRVIPRESDYNISRFLFMEGRAAATIDGPWAWTGYADAGIDFGLARIPKIDETGLWSSPMVSALGYSVNINAPDEKLPAIREVIELLTSAEMQIEMADLLATTPVHKAALADSSVINNDLLQQSMRQIEVGRPMPLAPSLRQIWDGARGPYQLVMNGSATPEEGARMMQENVEKLIRDTFL